MAALRRHRVLNTTLGRRRQRQRSAQEANHRRKRVDHLADAAAATTATITARRRVMLVRPDPVRPLAVRRLVRRRDGVLDSLELRAKVLQAVQPAHDGVDARLVQHRVSPARACRLLHARRQRGDQLLVTLAVHDERVHALAVAADFDLLLLLLDEHVEVVKRHVVVGRDAVLLEIHAELRRCVLHLRVLVLVLADQLLGFLQALLPQRRVAGVGGEVLLDAHVRHRGRELLKLVQDVQVHAPVVPAGPAVVVAAEGPAVDEPGEAHDLGRHIGQVALLMAVRLVLGHALAGAVILHLDAVPVRAHGSRHAEVLLAQLHLFELQLLAQLLTRQPCIGQLLLAVLAQGNVLTDQLRDLCKRLGQFEDQLARPVEADGAGY